LPIFWRQWGQAEGKDTEKENYIVFHVKGGWASPHCLVPETNGKH